MSVLRDWMTVLRLRTVRTRQAVTRVSGLPVNLERNLTGVLELVSGEAHAYSKIGHVNDIPTMQFFTGISRNTQSNSYMSSLTECVWEFQNNAF